MADYVKFSWLVLKLRVWLESVFPGMEVKLFTGLNCDALTYCSVIGLINDGELRVRVGMEYDGTVRVAVRSVHSDGLSLGGVYNDSGDIDSLDAEGVFEEICEDIVEATDVRFLFPSVFPQGR